MISFMKVDDVGHIDSAGISFATPMFWFMQTFYNEWLRVGDYTMNSKKIDEIFISSIILSFLLIWQTAQL